ncbi:reverse transcriptase domain-containing protein [Tanacetum coccineum]
MLRDIATSFDSAVHRVHAVSFDAAVASPVSAACVVAAGYIVSAGFMMLLHTLLLLLLNPLASCSFLLAVQEVPADYVSADREVRFCWQFKKFLLIMFLLIERSVGYNPKNWSEKLDDALWAFRTAYKTPTGCTPFRLVYEKDCHLPMEHTSIPASTRKELRDGMNLGPEEIKILKLDTRTVEITDRNGISFKVNGQRLKKYYDGRNDTDDKEDLTEKNPTMLVTYLQSGSFDH